MRKLGIAIAIVLLGSAAANAEVYEFLACKFREGKTMADLNRVIPVLNAANDQYKDGYQAVVLTPQYATNAPDFFWMGVWPDAEKMGLGLRAFFEKGIGNEALADLNAVVDCSADNSLWFGRTVYQQKK